jgi:hypothetical protein
VRWLSTSVPTTHDEESVSDVIVLREAIPETADVVARFDAVISQDSPRAMVAACRPQEEGSWAPGTPPGDREVDER